jgi:Uma2 family endonuclease
MATTLEELNEIINATAQPPQKVTFEEFLTLTNGVKKAEWIEGEVIYMAAASVRHELLFKFLLVILDLYTQKNDLGLILGSDIPMKLAPLRRGREPDILFLAKERLHLLQATYLDGPADVAIEIVSPESYECDTQGKFNEYEAAGVSEYWLLNPQRQAAGFYRLGEDKRYHLMETPDGVFRSVSIAGFWLRLEWLWALPAKLEVLRELGVI